MDAIKFIKERNRMCKTYKLKRCEGCPANNPSNYGGEGVACIMIDKIDAERLVPIVKNWSATHPTKTRQSVFLEQWPSAKIDKNIEVLTICPAELDEKYRSARGCCNVNATIIGVCDTCRREFWLKEV